MYQVLGSIALLICAMTSALAEDIKVISTGLFRGVLPALVPEFERATGHKVIVSIATPGVLRNKLLKGELFDVVFVPTNIDMNDVADAGIFDQNRRTIIGSPTFQVGSLRSSLPAIM